MCTSHEAVNRALEFITATIDHHGVARALHDFDPSFQQPLPGAAAEAKLRERGVTLNISLNDDTFSTILALTLLPTGYAHIPRLAAVVQGCRFGNRFPYFFTRKGFPYDTDSTGLAAGGLIDHGLMSPQDELAIGQELLLAVAPYDRVARDGAPALKRGVLMMYWEDGREPHSTLRGYKQDPVACAHVLYVLEHARELGLVDTGGVRDATLQYVVEHLSSERYRQGSRYYVGPAPFLYAASRLWRFDGCRARLSYALPQAVNRLHDDRPQSPLFLAQYIIAADNLGLDRHQPECREQLAAQQASDGSWPACAYYRAAQHPIYFGSRVLTTLFAQRALQPTRCRDLTAKP
ncbi:hypothetical protein [Streptomyces wuyuanensis]|uniref:hypothetical protein n=1 Tax=Streptomyces wuyuanensis TaxID=1196353 RepID=UPI00344513B3